MKIDYDKPIEVTEKQYHYLMGNFGGIVAGRKENNKFFIKVWLMKYAPLIEDYLTKELQGVNPLH